MADEMFDAGFWNKAPSGVAFELGIFSSAKRPLPESADEVAATADPSIDALDPCNATEPPSELRR